MGFLDRIVGRGSQGAFEKVPVSLEDLQVGIWENKEGRIRVKSLDPFDVRDCVTDQVLLFEDGLEGLRRKLEEGGYALASVQPDPAVPVESEGSDTTVVDINETLERRKAGQGLEIEIVDAYAALVARLGEVAPFLQQAGGTEEIASFREQVSALITQADEIKGGTAVDQTSDEDPVQMTEAHLIAKRERLEQMRALLSQAESLQAAMLKKKPVERGSARAARRAAARAGVETVDGPAPETAGAPDVALGSAAAAHAGNLEALRQAAMTAPQAPEGAPAATSENDPSKAPVKNRKTKKEKPTGNNSEAGEKAGDKQGDEPRVSGGPGGPEGPEEFGTVLGLLEREVGDIIAAIKTPEDFGKLRGNMAQLPAKEADREPRRYFFRLKTIRERIGGREMSDEERQLVTKLENELWERANQKFWEVQEADLATQYQRELARLNAAKDQEALATLAQAWTQESPFTNSWQAVFGDLTERERESVQESYQRKGASLLRSLERRQGRFLDAQEVEHFLERPEGKQIMEICRTILPGELNKLRGALKYRKIQLTREVLLAEWNEYYFPVIRKSIVEYLRKQPDMTEEQSEAIFRVLAHEFEQAEGMKEKKNKRL